jgi:hypothetical protein
MIVALSVLVGSVGDDPAISLSDFVNRVRGLQSEIATISMYYEGELSFVGPQNLRKKMKRRSSQKFQGFYVYRTDGATLCDIYSRDDTNELPFLRTIHLLFGRKCQVISYAHHEKIMNIQPRSLPAYPGALSGTLCPERIQFNWLFNSIDESGHLADVGVFEYEFLGWDMVNDAKCLKIKLSPKTSQDKKDRWDQFYWIDLNRGANVLKFELYVGDDLLARIDNVELELVESRDKKHVWLPVAGVQFSYRWEDEFFKSPVFQERISVVRNSINVNKKYDDKFFDIINYLKATTKSYLVDGMTLAKEFHHTLPRSDKTDPDGVNRRLDDMLKIAEQQVEHLALSAAPEDASRFTIIDLVYLALLILFIVCIVLYIKHKVS